METLSEDDVLTSPVPPSRKPPVRSKSLDTANLTALRNPPPSMTPRRSGGRRPTRRGSGGHSYETGGTSTDEDNEGGGNAATPSFANVYLSSHIKSPSPLRSALLKAGVADLINDSDDTEDEEDHGGLTNNSFGVNRYLHQHLQHQQHYQKVGSGNNSRSTSGSSDEGSRGAGGNNHHTRAKKRGSSGKMNLTKADSERRLREALSRVADYSQEEGNTLQSHFKRLEASAASSANSSSGTSIGTPNSKRRVMQRRVSMSSVDSEASLSLQGTNTDASIDLLSDAMNTSIRSGSQHSYTNAAFMMMHQSSVTLPATNVVRSDKDRRRKNNMKNEQIIESLVWFSFHTPRTVLEDLISHELTVWRNVQQQAKKEFKPKKHHQHSNNNSFNKSNKKKKLSMDDDSENSSEQLDTDEDSTSQSEEGANTFEMDTKNFKEKIIKMQDKKNSNSFMKLPKSVHRESALLFVDMSGFTKLSTMLDVESLSKVINAYFDMIVTEVIQHGGDILKFAGDAFFAEWRVVEEAGSSDEEQKNPLADLNASLASVGELAWCDDDDDDVPKLSTCALMAARCACAIVAKYSDYHVTSPSNNKSEAMLNVHCGVGVGPLTGLHVGDFKEDQEEDAVELRREFLILGEPIEQVSKAAEVANDGEVYASPEAMLALAYCVEMKDEQRICNAPIIIASRGDCFLNIESPVISGLPTALQPYESLRMHCKSLNNTALARLHLQMALYVHPVIRGDELALSAAIQAGKISQPTETLESRHRAEAELRSVFTLFIKAIMSPRVTGMEEIDRELHQSLHDIMHVTSRELDRYSGHLRQFIVDDKGVVLIATFGLRGSTFPNMVANNALPAAFAIHRALKTELKVENRIGATFGKVYCGVVGGIRRHEFAVMGAPVNLAARLMCSKENRGILVDEAVQQQAGDRYTFNSLPPVQAKGYDRPVHILEPLPNVPVYKKKKSVYPFIGRREEKKAMVSVAVTMLEDTERSESSMIFLMGESGMGKSALAASVVEDIRKRYTTDDDNKKIVIAARSTSNETEQRIPLSSFRQVFLSLIRDHCEYDGSLTLDDDSAVRSMSSRGSTSGGFGGLSLRSMHGTGLRRQSMSQRQSFHQRASVSQRQPAPKRPSLSRSPHNKQLATPISSGSPPGSLSDKRPSLMWRPSSQRGGGGGGDNSLSSDFTSNDSECTPSQMGSFLKGLSFQRRNSETGKKGNSLQKYLPGGYGMNNTMHGTSTSNSSENTPLSRTPKPAWESLSQSLHRLNEAESSSSHQRIPRDSQAGSVTRPSLARAISAQSPMSTPLKPASMRQFRLKTPSSKGVKMIPDDSSAASFDNKSTQHLIDSVPYFEKLCWICEQLDYPFEYADIIGSQFLGLESANPVTHVDGHVPTMDELVEFLAQAFICVTDFANLSIVVLDDFQWADAFSWKIFRALCKTSTKMLLMCLTRSHDKQALRRLSTALMDENSLQTKLTEIALGPLDFTDIRELIAMIMEVELSAVNENLCTDIFQRTGGLPVFVVQTLENIKRKKTLEVSDGLLKWTAEGLKEKRALGSSNNAAVMEETFLSRFDSLDVRVRKVLQTCAVLGLEFALTDVIQVHPEMAENEIENSLDIAVDEMILVEHLVDDDDNSSLRSGTHSEDTDNNTYMNQSRSSRSSSRAMDDRFFQFSHAMWRNNVLTTMLKERKIELHRLIAESMERDQVLVLEQSDISRLLTLFEHWKSCGDFCKAAPLALAVGARLEEWDLSAQSLELYEDALELSFDSVFSTGEEKSPDTEWVQVKAKPMVLDLILRLHICIGLCHQRLGDPTESVLFFEDAYSIIKSASKVPGMSKALMMPIISSLCVLKLDLEVENAGSGGSGDANQQEGLIKNLMTEAEASGNAVHISRAYSIQATREARLGHFQEAVECADNIMNTYDIMKHCGDMLAEYGSDFALATIAESVQWLYLAEQQEKAEQRADYIMDELLPQIDPVDVDDTMTIVLPVIQVLMLMDRANDADWLLKKYIINPYHESGQVSFWSPLFNPLAYVLELILMEESEQYDAEILEDLEAWVLEEENSRYDVELERKAHTLMGELCWRLAYNKADGDPSRDVLLEKASDLLTPIARYPHPEIFLKHTARALLEAL